MDRICWLESVVSLLCLHIDLTVHSERSSREPRGCPEGPSHQGSPQAWLGCCSGDKDQDKKKKILWQNERMLTLVCLWLEVDWSILEELVGDAAQWWVDFQDRKTPFTPRVCQRIQSFFYLIPNNLWTLALCDVTVGHWNGSAPSWSVRLGCLIHERSDKGLNAPIARVLPENRELKMFLHSSEENWKPTVRCGQLPAHQANTHWFESRIVSKKQNSVPLLN